MCKTLHENELVDRMILFEYGQIMNACYRWTSFLASDEGPNRKYVKDVIERAGNVGWFEKLKIKRWLSPPYKDEKNNFFYHFNMYM